jgi:hypothetical protein
MIGRISLMCSEFVILIRRNDMKICLCTCISPSSKVNLLTAIDQQSLSVLFRTSVEERNMHIMSYCMPVIPEVME